MKKKRADGEIQKNDYVQLIGNVPERLKRAATPILGTVTKVKGDIATIKPRYKRFELEIPVKDLKDIPYEEFNTKQKNHT